MLEGTAYFHPSIRWKYHSDHALIGPQTGVYHVSLIEGIPWNPSNITALILRGIRWPSIRPPLWRETPVSWTGNVIFPSLGLFQSLLYMHGGPTRRFLCRFLYTEKTRFPFHFSLNGIWSWGQFSFRFWTQMEFPFGSENRNENCHHNHIPFTVKGLGNIVFSVYSQK